MSRRQLFKAAASEVRAGKDRRQVFQDYQGKVRPESGLAMAIATVPDPERMKRYAALNYVLVALLILAALLKALHGFMLFREHSIFLGVGAIFLGILLPLILAIGAARFDGQIYPLLIVLCVLNALNLALKWEQYGSDLLADFILLAIILGLAIALKQKLFPNIGIFRVKKDAQGSYLF